MGRKLFQYLILCGLTGLFTGGLNAQLAGAEQQRLADGLYARDLFDLALVEYQKLILLDPPPDHLDLLYYRAGECASHLGQTEMARTYFDKAIALGGQSLPAQRSRYRLADEAYRSGRLAEAEKQLQMLLEQGVGDSIEVPVRFTLAQILEKRNQQAEALRMYEHLIQNFPGESLSAYAALRVATLSGGSADQKREIYARALRNPPSRDFEIEALWGLASLESSAKNSQAAAKIYWQLWQEFPDSTRVRGSMIYLAWAQLQAGEFQRALTLSAETSDTRKASDADTWLYLDAVSHQKLDQPEASLKAYEALLEKHPQSRFRSLAVYEVAGNYAAKGDHAKVLGYAKELQSVPGREVDGLWLLAESARGAGENALALQVYTRIAHQFPKHERAGDALYFKALMLTGSGDPAMASAALVDFQRRFPDDPRALSALEQAGDLLIKNGQIKQGLEKWLEVLKLNPDADPQLLFNIAMLEFRNEETASAQQHLELYLTKELPAEKKAEGQYWLGVLLDRQGEDEKAQQALEEALEGNRLKPDLQTAARMRLGQSYTRKGHPEKALSAFLPLLGTEKEKELSDGLLLWLMPVAEEAGQPGARKKIASAMVKEPRKPATRELGYYALAEFYKEASNPGEAGKAWKAGLDFQSGTLEAAQAHLAYADFLLAEKKYPEAFEQYSKGTQLASGLEQGRLQARGMMGSGQVRRSQKQWAEAAKYFMSVAVLFDDPALSPEALKLAADAFRKSGQEEKAAAAERELNTRYPPPAEPTP